MKELLPDLLLFVGHVRDMTTVEILEALEEAGLSVRMAASCEEALTAMRFLPVKLVVVGLDDEEDTWRMIRVGRDLGREVPVACVSGVPTRSRVLAALRRGAHTFLAARFTTDDVRRKLSPLLAEQSAGSNQI